MDINLLNDTKDDRPKKKPVPQLSSEPKLTEPGRLPKPIPEPKLPSRFSIWLRSLRNKKPVNEEPKTEPSKPVEKPNIPHIRMQAPLKSPTPEDIFSEIDAPDLKADTTPPIKNAVQEPAPAPKIIDLPPVPAAAPPPAPAPVVPPPTPKAKLKPLQSIKEKIKTKEKKPKGEFEPPFTNRGSLVNLIPLELRQSIDPRSKLISLSIAICASLVFIGGVYAVLTLYRTSILEKIQLLRADRMVIEQSITEMKPRQREAISVNEQLKLVSGLLDSHIYWTKFFSKLEKYTIDDVYYTGALAGSLGGQMTLTAVGSSFSAPARQLLVLEAADDFVSNVTITSAVATEGTSAILPPGSLSTTKVTFSVTITLVPDIFNYTAESFPANRTDGLNGPRATDAGLDSYGIPFTGLDEGLTDGTIPNSATNGNANINGNINRNLNVNSTNSGTNDITDFNQ